MFSPGHQKLSHRNSLLRGFPGGSVVKNPLPMQETWVQSLIWENPTCHEAAKPVHHKSWAWALEPWNQSYWAHEPMSHNYQSPSALEPALHKRSLHNEQPVRTTTKSPPLTTTRGKPTQHWDPAQPKIKKFKKKNLLHDFHLDILLFVFIILMILAGLK